MFNHQGFRYKYEESLSVLINAWRCPPHSESFNTMMNTVETNSGFHARHFHLLSAQSDSK